MINKQQTIGQFYIKGEKGMKWYFFSLVILFTTVNAFTQEVEISPWGYGLETSFDITSLNGLPSNYSASFQGVHDDYGYGLSLDWIHKARDEYSSSKLWIGSGLFVSAFGGLRLSKFFIPYVGGGLGIDFNDGESSNFTWAWKFDTGVISWLSNIMYVKVGVMHDDIRKDYVMSVGLGFKMEKSVTATYRDYNGTFQRTFTKHLWNDNSTPNNLYDDKFDYSEIVRRYQRNTTSSSYSPPQYEYKTSGGETYRTTHEDQYGRTIGTSTTTTPEKSEFIRTQEGKTTTHYYLWNVTVTRKWYTRTYYYKDRAPTTKRIYQDSESAVLANSWTETKEMRTF
jgi:hypothetical protein